MVSAGSTDCWTQFQQCTASGLPTCRRMELYQLCQNIYGTSAVRLDVTVMRKNQSI